MISIYAVENSKDGREKTESSRPCAQFGALHEGRTENETKPLIKLRDKLMKTRTPNSWLFEVEKNKLHIKLLNGDSWKMTDLEHIVQVLVDSISLFQPPHFSRPVSIVDCGLCLCIMIEPTTLPCGHTFCKKCLSNSSSNEESTNAACKRCKLKYNPSDLKTNVVVARVIEKWWPEAVKAYNLRSEASVILDENIEEAISKYKTAISLDPLDQCTSLELAEALMKHGQAEEALSYAEIGIKCNPKSGKSYFVKSGALVSLGRYEDSIISYLYCLHFGFNISEVKKEIHKLLLKVCQQSQVCERVSSYQEQCVNLNKSIFLKNDCESDPPYFSSKKRMIQASPSAKSVKKIESEKLQKLFDRCMHQIDTINVSKYVDSNVRPVNWDLVDKQDLECPLCIRLFWEPVTTPCGHMYCKRCLDRSLDHQILCPLCKTSLEEYLAQRRQALTEIVELTIQNFLPTEALDRKKVHEEELATIKRVGTNSMQDVPLFICTIAFPTIPCPLHIYEPRYRLMTRQCVESGSRMFGMCASVPESETGNTYGTMLMIRDMHFLPDGRSIVDTIGARRFKVLEMSMRDGYHIGNIEYINDDSIDNGSETFQELKVIHDDVYRISGLWYENLPSDTKDRISYHFGPRPVVSNDNLFDDPDGPAWFWWLIAVLPLEAQLQMSLLGMQSLKKRLEVVYRVLEYLQSNSLY